MNKLRAISTDDSVNSCDCCGKTGLKYTVVMIDESGEIFHYGCICAVRNSGKDRVTIKNEIAQDIQDRIIRASSEWNQCNAKMWLDVKMAEAHKLKLVGSAFKNFCKHELEFADKIKNQIAEDNNLKPYQF